ncbi:MAG TPA: PqiC family protein [Caldimonas sp.]|nr:PqiC family protein [Caldimonas sp.]
MRARPFFSLSVQRAACAVLAFAALALVACSTPPVPRFYSLMPGEVASRPAASRPAAGAVIVLEPVRIPIQVDQPQWVVRLPDDSVAVLEQERWTTALRDEFQAALLEELIVGHGMVDARTQPAPGTPPWRIAVDVRRFESLPGREARIEGSWTIQGGSAARSAGSRCEWLLREPAPGALAELAPAHRRAIARLADAIAQAIGRASRGEPAPCPPPDPPR